MMHRLNRIRTVAVMVAAAGILSVPLTPALAAPCGSEHISIHHNFTSGNLNAWEFPHAEDWEIQQQGGVHYLHMKRSRGPELPRHPVQFARLKGVKVGSFTLDVDVRSIEHSLAIQFNYEDPLHFYYIHFSDVPGTKIFQHNGIFIVDGAARHRIAGVSAAPSLPDHQWHHVRIVRNAETGWIEGFVDHEKYPRFSIIDHHFTCGQVGLGSFDETGDFAHFHLVSDDAEVTKAAK